MGRGRGSRMRGDEGMGIVAVAETVAVAVVI